MLNIALDAMGGDFAPAHPVHGACLAVQKRDDIHIVLTGDKDAIERELFKHGMQDHARLSVLPASQVIEMAESPAVAFRKKKDSSIHVGLNAVKDQYVDGFMSAGNTGAVMAAATFILGRIDQIERPAIAGVVPTKKNPMVLLDMGSNVDCKPSHLHQFAIMGSHFAQDVLDIPSPKVALFNIGEEDDKGNQLTQAVFPLLKEEKEITFIGNVEGKNLMDGHCDVVVCDGFVGNSLLKFGEGVVQIFFDFFKQEWKRSLRSKLALLLLAPALKWLKKHYDYDETGGAPLLGVNGVAFISHGSSSAYAIQNGLLNVAHAIESDMVGKIAKAVAKPEAVA